MDDFANYDPARPTNFDFLWSQPCRRAYLPFRSPTAG